jgi:hypothetical protein
MRLRIDNVSQGQVSSRIPAITANETSMSGPNTQIRVRPGWRGSTRQDGRKFLLVTSLLVAILPSTLLSAWLRWQGDSIVWDWGGGLKGATAAETM